MSGSARAIPQPRRSGSYHRAEETQSYEDATSDGRGDVQLSLRIAPAEPDESRDMRLIHSITTICGSWKRSRTRRRKLKTDAPNSSSSSSPFVVFYEYLFKRRCCLIAGESSATNVDTNTSINTGFKLFASLCVWPHENILAGFDVDFDLIVLGLFVRR